MPLPFVLCLPSPRENVQLDLPNQIEVGLDTSAVALPRILHLVNETNRATSPRTVPRNPVNPSFPFIFYPSNIKSGPYPSFSLSYTNCVIRTLCNRAYSKNQYGSIQSRKRAGGKAAYNDQKRKRKGGMQWKP